MMLVPIGRGSAPGLRRRTLRRSSRSCLKLTRTTRLISVEFDLDAGQFQDVRDAIEGALQSAV